MKKLVLNKVCVTFRWKQERETFIFLGNKDATKVQKDYKIATEILY